MRGVPAIVIAAMFVFFAEPAAADPYRWCAIYRGGGSESCYFMTLEQCQASVSGRAGFCRPNYYRDNQGGSAVQPDTYRPRRR